MDRVQWGPTRPGQARPGQTRPVQTLLTKLMPRRRQTPDAVVAIVAAAEAQR